MIKAASRCRVSARPLAFRCNCDSEVPASGCLEFTQRGESSEEQAKCPFFAAFYAFPAAGLGSKITSYRSRL